MPVLTTPDGHYIVVRGRLWRATNPALSASQREALVQQLIDARRALRRRFPADTGGVASSEVGTANNADPVRQARQSVDAAKRGLGERGPVWWTDGAPDFNRKLVKNTPYAAWHAQIATTAS